MISFIVNGRKYRYEGATDRSLLSFLRDDLGIYSPKNACSGEGVCGACTVEVNGRSRLACTISIHKLEGASILTLEGLPAQVRESIAAAFVNKGAVQCGFCTPGIISRTSALLSRNPTPSREEMLNALKPHLCRCTGYQKILQGIQLASDSMRDGLQHGLLSTSAKIGDPHPNIWPCRLHLGQGPSWMISGRKACFSGH